jgi:hypothetical protein
MSCGSSPDYPAVCPAFTQLGDWAQSDIGVIRKPDKFDCLSFIKTAGGGANAFKPTNVFAVFDSYRRQDGSTFTQIVNDERHAGF